MGRNRRGSSRMFCGSIARLVGFFLGEGFRDLVVHYFDTHNGVERNEEFSHRRHRNLGSAPV